MQDGCRHGTYRGGAGAGSGSRAPLSFSFFSHLRRSSSKTDLQSAQHLPVVSCQGYRGRSLVLLAQEVAMMTM